MIVVTVTQTGITISGHAGYAEYGKDIICAAVSALSHGLVHSLEALTNDAVTVKMEDGRMELFYKDLSERGMLLVDSFFIAISDIAISYGEEYLKIL